MGYLGVGCVYVNVFVRVSAKEFCVFLQEDQQNSVGFQINRPNSQGRRQAFSRNITSSSQMCSCVGFVEMIDLVLVLKPFRKKPITITC